MSFNNRNKKTEMRAVRTQQSGFSMIELMIVCVIMVLIAGIAVPNIFQTFRNYRLDAAGHSVASLLQQARMQAVKTNQPAYVSATNGTSGNIAFVSADNSTTYTPGNPDVQLSSAVTFQPPPTSPSGFHTQLDTYLSGGATGMTSQVVGGGTTSIGFNARGLPCTEAPGGNPVVCSLPSGTSGYIWFMQGSNGWEAVTVTPSGRIKSWRLVNQTNSTWQ